MSIRRDLIIKVSNGTATLDMPLQIYEKDHGIELRFKLMDYKYKYDKDPENILNSNKEDILEAYTTIVNPLGYELAQINGEVVDDTIKFMIEDSYTDELEELGTYQLQIHVKCTHSEFSIPPVRFEVLERLKGEKVVTDGDDEVDHSDIIDGSTKFIDDETGKLIIQWQKGDTISSVRLNAMVEVINNAVDEEAQRQLNELEREQQELEREQQELERENRLQAALDSVDARVDASMNDYETRFNALTASQQQDMEVIDARDSEVSLKARLDRDVRNPLQVYEDVEGSYISCDSTDGYIQNVEILGNTIQDADNLADIRSVGDKVEGQELYEIDVLSCGKNLITLEQMYETFVNTVDGDNYTIFKDGVLELKWNGAVRLAKITSIKFKPNTRYTFTFWCKSDSTWQRGMIRIKYTDGTTSQLPNSNTSTTEFTKQVLVSDENKTIDYIWVNLNNNLLINKVQLEEDTVATEYEPYQEDKLTILSPVQLEKVGDVADRIICKDGVWGVEKNITDLILNGDEVWLAPATENQINTKVFRMDVNELIENSLDGKNICISDTYKTINTQTDYKTDNIEYICASAKKIYIRIKNEKLTTLDVSGFKQYLEKNNVIVKYQTAISTFIPLPHDQQVKLRTFAGKTNISFLTEIEGTIKAQIPHSLGATINSHSEQIDNLSEELDRVKKLEESTVSTVTTESGFTTVTETANGYFEDVKLEGRTLVNLCPKNGVDGKSEITYRYNTAGEVNYLAYSNLDVNKTYTAIIEGDNKNFKFSVYDNSNGVSTIIVAYSNDNVIKFNPTSTNDTRIYVRTAVEGLGEYTHKFILLEGDHTQNPPSYFEGLMSVGQDVDEMSIQTKDGYKGIIYKDNLVAYYDDDGNIVTSFANNLYGEVISVKPNTTYTVQFNQKANFNARIYGYSSIPQNSVTSVIDQTIFETNNQVKNLTVTFTTNDNINYLFIGQYQGTLFYTDYIIDPLPYEQDKKQILYYNPTTQSWEKPVLREWDSIEKHSDGKYYYHKRSGEVVIDETTTFEFFGIEDGWVFSRVTLNDKKVYTDNTVSIGLICDRFNQITFNDRYNTSEGIYHSNNRCILKLTPTKLLEQSLKGYLSWLEENPITVVYLLAEEKVYECTDLDLIAYADETNLIVKSGAITPKTTLKVHNNAANVVTLLQKKTLKLEESAISRDRKIAAIETKLETPAVQVEGSYISCDSTNGYAQNVEILGNTIQDADNLADIRSVGEEVEGQELYEIPVLSCGVNLFNINDYKKGGAYRGNGFLTIADCYYSEKLINIKPNTTYYYLASDGSYKPVSYTNFYDENKNFIIEINDKTFVTSTSNARYMRISPWEDVIDIDNPLDYIGEENKYTQYQENKLTILSPVQLEKVGDVSDRIICKDGVWGVEKNIKTYIFTSSTIFSSATQYDTENTSYFHSLIGVIDVPKTTESGCILSSYGSTFSYGGILGVDTPGVSIGAQGNIRLRLDKSISLVDFMLEEHILKYQIQTPQFIPLPHDQQVKLRTFAGETNISFLTEIEGTIKASIPQSISSTISTHTEQIDNLNKELDRVKKLEESTVSTVVTESDFTTVKETSNGYFEDVKIEGRTLVNLVTNIGDLNLSYETNIRTVTKHMNRNCSSITIFANVVGNTHPRIQLNFADDTYNTFDFTDGMYIIDTGKKIKSVIFYIPTASFVEGVDVNISNIIILEGDHTQNPPSYFEGLMSVGEDVDKISVESVNKNLLEIEKRGEFRGYATGNPQSNINFDSYIAKVMANTRYRISTNGVTSTEISNVCFFDEGFNYIEGIATDVFNFVTPSNCAYLTVAVHKDLKNVQIEKGDNVTYYTPHQSDKKPLLYYNPTTQAWEKPILREWDSIEKHSDGKYYYHKRSGEAILSGDDGWRLASQNELVISFEWNAISIGMAGNRNPVISNKFSLSTDYAFTGNEEGIFTSIGGSTLFITINKSELSSQDVAGFKQWLQANPTTVVYQLAQEEVYECINIDLITYENETNFIVNAGVIAPKSTLKVMCNINNVVRELQQKVSNLENYIQHVMIDALNNALNE